ncbi:hypothetical protein BDV23DRAFT_185202 [Aspergillus alliaceus]|uniref:Mid2 domain-containing protein n=1 Tax=Petromyces alliaceus TaxID=209559 RepID=A0A5N7C3B6_PETAA|nr:hypothetical protein BDV23DRAFT_185202 [Aspergillus alliaceus]
MPDRSMTPVALPSATSTTSETSSTFSTTSATDSSAATTTVAPTQTSPALSSSSSSGVNKGTIVGGVIGGVAGVALIAAFLWLFMKGRSRPQPIPIHGGDIPIADYKYMQSSPVEIDGRRYPHELESRPNQSALMSYQWSFQVGDGGKEPN